MKFIGRSSVERAGGQLAQFGKNGLMRSSSAVQCTIPHFSSSNGGHGGKTTSAVPKRRTDVCIAIRSGTRCRRLRSHSENERLICYRRGTALYCYCELVPE